jgi:hypothetical protein
MPIPGSLCNYPWLIGLPDVSPPPLAWQPGHDYVVDDKVINGANIYKCVVGGHSAASGGPTGIGSGIVDNTATWDWVVGVPTVPAITLPTLPIPPCLLDEF